MTNQITDSTERLYTRQFFQIFAAVALFMTGVALQFHFGQYIEYLGHGVDTLGRILGIAMVGTLVFRLRMGRWIDRFGCRPTWVVGSLVVAVSVAAMQLSGQLWVITLLRTITMMAMATVLTTVSVLAALIAPPRRRAESIGTMGMAGFTGLIVGPTLGDWILSGSSNSIDPYRIFFTTTAVCSVGSALVMMCLPTTLGRGPVPVRNPKDPNHDGAPGPSSTPQSQLRIVTRHWPGAVLVVGVVFAVAFCWQSMFLERLAQHRGFEHIKVFFLCYGPTAILLRLVFRRLPERFGRTRTLLLGLCLLATGQLCLTQSYSQGQLVLPGLLMGAGHCFVFPSMVDLAAERLPLEHRGTGTALILGAGDVGMLIGFVGLGEVIDAHGFNTALMVLAATVLAGAAFVAVARREDVFFRDRREPARRITV